MFQTGEAKSISGLISEINRNFIKDGERHTVDLSRLVATPPALTLQVLGDRWGGVNWVMEVKFQVISKYNILAKNIGAEVVDKYKK